MDLTCDHPLITEEDRRRGYCFGCHAKTLILVVPRRMSWKNEDLQAEHTAAAKQHIAKNPERYVPAGSRWV